MLNDNNYYKLNIMYWLCIGYVCRADKNTNRHDGHADKNPYRHDGRADKNPYRHDRRADSQCFQKNWRIVMPSSMIRNQTSKALAIYLSICPHICIDFGRNEPEPKRLTPKIGRNDPPIKVETTHP